MTPLRTKLLAVLWAASLLWVYQFADRNVRNEYEAAKVPAMAKDIEKHNVKAAKGNQVEKKSMANQAKTDATFEKLDSEVADYAKQTPVADDCSIGPYGLRIWRAANANTETVPASEPDEGLRGLAPARQWPDAGPAVEPREVGQEVPPVPGAAAGAGGMDRGEQ